MQVNWNFHDKEEQHLNWFTISHHLKYFLILLFKICFSIQILYIYIYEGNVSPTLKVGQWSNFKRTPHATNKHNRPALIFPVKLSQIWGKSYHFLRYKAVEKTSFQSVSEAKFPWELNEVNENIQNGGVTMFSPGGIRYIPSLASVLCVRISDSDWLPVFRKERLKQEGVPHKPWYSFKLFP